MSSDFSEFLGQPFITTMLSILCVVFLLLVGTIAALVYVRRRKAQQKLAASAPPGFVTAASYMSSGHDMPDLDLLVHTPAQQPRQSPAAAVAPAPAAASAPAPIRSARKGTFTVVPKDGSSTEAVEVLTILRDVVDGKLLVQMGESTYYNVNNNAEFKERFNKLMREVGQMVTKPAAPTQTTVDHEPEAPAVETETASPLPAASDLTEANEPSFLAPKKPAVSPNTYAPSGTLPGDLPSFKLEDNPMQKLKRGQKANLPPVPEINIAGAIEAYLQHKLAQTPEYANRSIHIYPAPGGGVSIEVDGKYFEAVSDVNDVEIREFLSDTITEWQERH
ncbi:MAG: hypothetical protein GC179_00235 [Anaerolineaceae bacterium]|nr:hypothetical protein [Anaerolineaceae bacterium]